MRAPWMGRAPTSTLKRKTSREKRNESVVPRRTRTFRAPSPPRTPDPPRWDLRSRRWVKPRGAPRVGVGRGGVVARVLASSLAVAGPAVLGCPALPTGRADDARGAHDDTRRRGGAHAGRARGARPLFRARVLETAALRARTRGSRRRDRASRLSVDDGTAVWFVAAVRVSGRRQAPRDRAPRRALGVAHARARCRAARRTARWRGRDDVGRARDGGARRRRRPALPPPPKKTQRLSRPRLPAPRVRTRGPGVGAGRWGASGGAVPWYPLDWTAVAEVAGAVRAGAAAGFGSGPAWRRPSSSSRFIRDADEEKTAEERVTRGVYVSSRARGDAVRVR